MDRKISTLEISDFSKMEHRIILKTIRQNSGFNLFGNGLIEESFNNHKGRKTRFYNLTEEQCCYLFFKFKDSNTSIKCFDYFKISKMPMVEIRQEFEFLKILNSIVSAFNETSIMNLSIHQQYPIGKYKVDFCIVLDYEDGYIGEHLIIELDEYLSHKYTKECDQKRKSEIMKILFLKAKENDCEKPKFIRVCGNDIYKGIKDITIALNSSFLNIL